MYQPLVNHGNQLHLKFTTPVDLHRGFPTWLATRRVLRALRDVPPDEGRSHTAHEAGEARRSGALERETFFLEVLMGFIIVFCWFYRVFFVGFIMVYKRF